MYKTLFVAFVAGVFLCKMLAAEDGMEIGVNPAEVQAQTPVDGGGAKKDLDSEFKKVQADLAKQIKDSVEKVLSKTADVPLKIREQLRSESLQKSWLKSIVDSATVPIQKMTVCDGVYLKPKGAPITEDQKKELVIGALQNVATPQPGETASILENYIENAIKQLRDKSTQLKKEKEAK